MKKLTITTLVTLATVLTACGETNPPMENRVDIAVTEKPIVTQECSITDTPVTVKDTEEFVYFALLDEVTKEEMGHLRIPIDYVLNKAKITNELKVGRMFICAQEKIHSDLLGFYTRVDELEDSINCTAASFSTPDGFDFRMEIKTTSYNDFIWKMGEEHFPGECATDESIVLEKMSDVSGWYSDGDNFHVILTYDCGSVEFVGNELEKLKEVVNVMAE